MKLSVETHVLHKRYGDEKAILMLKKAGFDSIDYSFYWLDESDQTLGDEYRSYACKVRQLLDENHMTCNQAHAPLGLLKYDSIFDTSNEGYLKLIRSIESAAIMGAENIVVHALKVPANMDVFACNLEFYKKLEPYCEKFGIRIAVENLFWYDKNSECCREILTPEQLKRMVGELGSKCFTVCLDVGHAAVTGYEPDELIRCFSNDTLQALHIQDNDYRKDRHTLPYTGSLDWKKIMQALKDIDYKGDFTFEIFGYLRKLDDDFMEEALAFAAKTGRKLLRMI